MISYNDSRFIIGKEEYFPYAAEMHYFRVPKRYWSICFERIRKAGFRIISTIVPWNLHEDSNREFDFSGFTDPSKDLIVFVELVREFGFKLILRPGPWVYSEYNLNALPKFLEKYPEVFARDKDGNMIRSSNRADVKSGYYPCMIHPRFLNFVRHYLNGLTEIIKNYVYPRGPLFLLELDYGDYFGGQFSPHMADYNEHVTGVEYPAWLEAKYEDIKTLNKAYSSKYGDFAEVEPPTEFGEVAQKEMVRNYDWFAFKESLMESFQMELLEMYRTFSCEPMFLQTVPYSHEPAFSPMANSHPLTEDGVLGASLCWDVGTGDNLARVRHLRSHTAFPYVTELPIGNWSYNPSRSNEYYPIGADATKYMITTALMGGAKGMTYHMVAGRDHWYGSALASDGTIQESYELIKTFNIAAQEKHVSSFADVTDTAIAVHRPYAWETLMGESSSREVTAHLMTHTIRGIGRDLDMLKIDHAFGDLSVPSTLEKYKTLIILISEVMDEHEQQFIVDCAKSGHNILLIGTVPLYDTSMRSCTVLSSALRCKTQKDFVRAQIVAEGEEFGATVFGTLRTTEKRKRILAKMSQKVVALSYSKFKGSLVLLSFDPSTDSNHHKMRFIEQILRGFKLKSYVGTSNPHIRAVVKRRDKELLLLLSHADPPLQFKESPPVPTNTTVRVDLKGLGFKSAKVRLTELFTEEVINTTAAQLISGISLTMPYLDGRAYLIKKR
jgi:beta-galactosidase